MMDFAELMFWVASIWILPFWSLMWFAPNHQLTHRFVGDLRWCFMPLLIPYVLLAIPEVSTILLLFGTQMPTPEIVINLFEDPNAVMLAWLHLLAFDLFLGRYIWLRMVAAERPLYVSTPILILCILMAPLGVTLGLAATWNKVESLDSLLQPTKVMSE